MLKAWSHLSLIERASIIRDKFKVPHFTHTALASYYKRLRITYRKPQIVYSYKERNHETIAIKQKEFALTFGQALMEGKHEIIYLDETTFNLW